MKKIAFVGLGLIGGSLAMALKGFEDCQRLGVVRRQATADYALSHDVVDAVTLDPAEALPQADVTVLCMDPRQIVDYMKRNRDLFQPGSLVVDVCGIKTAIMKGAEALPETVDFIGCHPMAGTEFSGIEHAFPTMFRDAHFIMTPRATSTPEHIALVRRMAKHLGCKDIITTTPEKHDSIIAYTSQLMHVVAAAVCDDVDLFQCRGFEGGSFRDVTRVAALDVDMWTELFTMNAPALSEVLRRMEDNLHAYRVAVENRDVERIHAKLTYSSERKRRMNLPGPGQFSLDEMEISRDSLEQ
ncbi:MAG: prephenate dehydrogenase/arogenate dehydrogenase family protein [Clostridiales bacterium]|nr:prephenate dehydrogenase/arogenate dehydrogenase family protein [Clostridiales bacterium]